jgi:nitrite reductase/ring-hydroxylating ferredoxin subunit
MKPQAFAFPRWQPVAAVSGPRRCSPRENAFSLDVVLFHMASAHYEHVTSLDTLAAEGRHLLTTNGKAIAVFHADGEVHAVDNRCPHMGFPLDEGTLDEGVLTCHWHHARFELSCGDTFDPWADDVPTYPVQVRDGEVYVRPEEEREEPPAVHWRDRLGTGLRENLRLVVAKAVIGLDDADVPYDEPFGQALAFGTEYREDGWASGLTIHTAMANIRADLEPVDRRRALYHGIVEVAGDCAGEPPRFDQPALRTDSVGPDRLRSWFRENVEVRDSDGAERCLRTAIRTLDQSDVAGMLFTAATDHRYLDSGHTLDFLNKAFEALDHVGWDRAEAVLPSLIPRLTDADRAEESAAWRQPVDLAAMLESAFEGLPATVPDGHWDDDGSLPDTLLGDDPAAVVDRLVAAVDAGATPTDLASVVRDAAATRVAQFSTGNEFSDWNTVHHTFTYANAVYFATRRTADPALYRGVFDAAANVYLDRFLNTPPAPIPDGDSDADPDAAIEALLDTFEREGAVNRAGECVADFLASGGDPARLRRELGGALVREDAGFHTVQHVEAAFRGAATTPAEPEVYLVAAARYLAAHTPTRRERDQTFRIADRLHRGERVHEGG